MSTKNLARTVIEGGRRHGNCWDRRNSNAVERTREREISEQLTRSTDRDAVVYPRRSALYRDFYDKLAPAERWLAKQVGRPWSKVRSEIFARFDARTTAGRHILFDHLLPSVSVGHRDPFCRFQLVVNRRGILKLAEPWKRRSTLPEPLPEPAEVLAAWLENRRVGERGTRLFWFVRTDRGYFRQERALSDAEAIRWGALPGWFKQKHDAYAHPPGGEA